ncbi:MAG TPA: DUF1232 domain-containing protein [Elusimicrobiota bacterium]|jgi:uncharacterized membrane protein YkvA (DUF1232 family)|nr:DUF1232 domain-containing protein [Elusimicrobiota bacterium]
MRYRQLLSLLEKSSISPEKAAAELGVSGMTLRRWREKPDDAELPELYRRAFEPLLRRLIGDGLVHPEDPDVLAAFATMEDPFQRTLLGLGITHEILRDGDKDSGTVTMGLARIGEDKNRQAQVKGSKRMLDRFMAMGVEWKNRIGDLNRVLRAEELTALDKLVAFGALFYLITPFDLIPDAIPVFGLVDDFIVLGIAVLYYRARFPHLFKDKKAARKA